MSSVAYRIYDGDECVADVDASGNPLRTYTWGQGIDIKRAQSPRRSSRATAILRPARRTGARSGIRRRSGNCHLLAVTVYAYQPNSPQPTASSYHAVKDHLGSVHALVDESGEIAAQFTYDAWGNVHSAVGNGQSAVLNRFLFQGREYSFATGLYNFRARWYDPATGRWLSKDPIGLEGGLNLYVFCGDDPVNMRDPWGESAVSVAGPATLLGSIALVTTAIVSVNYGNADAVTIPGLGVITGKNLARRTSAAQSVIMEHEAVHTLGGGELAAYHHELMLIKRYLAQDGIDFLGDRIRSLTCEERQELMDLQLEVEAMIEYYKLPFYRRVPAIFQIFMGI